MEENICYYFENIYLFIYIYMLNLHLNSLVTGDSYNCYRGKEKLFVHTFT